MLKKIGLFLDSKYFLAAVLGIFFLEATWIAFSFAYPMVYDEQYHYSIIKIFGTQISPFILNQPPEYDYLRDLGNETSFLYHYLMSYPFRLLELFNPSLYPSVIALRFINIIFATIGLVGYYLLLRFLKIPKRYINVGLLLFATLPIVSLTAATVNYDNMLFAIVPFYLLYSAKVISSRSVNFFDLAFVAILGLFASLVKYTFLPLFAAVTLILVVWLVYTHKKSLPGLLKNQTITAYKNRTKFFGVLTIFVMMFGLFSAVYLKNIVVYGTPSPSCTKTMERERCLKSSIVARNENAAATKAQRNGERLPDYSMQWIESMWKFTMMSASPTPSGIAVRFSPILYYTALFYAVIILTLSIAYGIGRGLFSTRAHLLMLVSCIVIITAVYIFNVNGYYKSYLAFANQPRYLLTAMPVLIVFGVYALAHALRRFRAIRYAILLFAIVILTVGGGLTTHVVVSDNSWYRPNQTVIRINEKLRSTSRALVVDSIRR